MSLFEEKNWKWNDGGSSHGKNFVPICIYCAEEDVEDPDDSQNYPIYVFSLYG